MIKQVDSWSKEDTTQNLIGRKKVDYSLLKTRETGIPKEFYDEFLEANQGIELQENEKQPIKIYLNGQQYEGYLLKSNWKGSRRISLRYKDQSLEKHLHQAFRKSLEYIEFQRREVPNIKKAIVVPDEFAEYLVFYKTNKPFEYVVQIQSYSGEIPMMLQETQNMERENTGVLHDLNAQEILQHIYTYIQSKGFFYEETLIQNIYLSLKSKPFLILAGTSGTGKSKLVRLFAESLGATSESGRYKLIPVKPDWSDSTDLLGYKDLSGTFHPGPLTKVLYEASQNPEQPYFICLDEMNLARVEYYLSDLLSLMETREMVGEEIKTDFLFSEDAFGNDSKSLEKYKQLYIPQNVYIIGTVNMDETTFPFSKKVLDRANTIEFSDVELSYDFDDILQEEIEPALLHNDFLKSEYLILKDCEAHRDVVQQTIEILKKINEILKEVNLHFGFRIRDEICYYRVYNEKFSIMEQDQAMDFQILQKILPRIQGSSSGIKRALIQLYILCANLQSKALDEGNIGVFEEMLALWKQQSASMPYPMAAQKIAFMMRRYEEDGFTSYWL